MYDAILSSEDPRFYQHGGVDLIGTSRALLQNLRGGGETQGGSSISQQYVKNVLIQRCERDADTEAQKQLNEPRRGRDRSGRDGDGRLPSAVQLRRPDRRRDPREDATRCSRTAGPRRRRRAATTASSASCRRCATRSRSSRSIPRTTSFSATSTSRTSAAGRTASTPPRGTTSTSRRRTSRSPRRPRSPASCRTPTRTASTSRADRSSTATASATTRRPTVSSTTSDPAARRSGHASRRRHDHPGAVSRGRRRLHVHEGPSALRAQPHAG